VALQLENLKISNFVAAVSHACGCRGQLHTLFQSRWQHQRISAALQAVHFFKYMPEITPEQVRKVRSAGSAALFSNSTVSLEEFLSLLQIDGFGETDSMNKNCCTAPASCMNHETGDNLL